MHAIANKRERLGRFVDLARVYRGWTKTELSAALHRDPTKLIRSCPRAEHDNEGFEDTQLFT